jgi:dihydroxyacetone kinase-like predicted kinase
MNPSTEDLVKAVNRVNAKKVIILPNNGNVIMTANQVKELVDHPVAVVPSKFIPQGISSLMVFNEAQTLEENVRAMTGALNGVKTVEVTYAVRASQYNGVKIEEGDIIGLLDGEIITTGKEIPGVLVEALKMAAGEGASLVTLYYGMDVPEEAARQGQSQAAEALPECETEIYRGGQPLYYYICSVE